MKFLPTTVIRRVQQYGLVGVTFMSFLPPLFHYEEYTFFVLLAVTLLLCWLEQINPFVRTPIDLPLFGFIGWVLCTVPFATDVSYSFSEWRKLVAHALAFYWATFVLRQFGADRKLARQILSAVVLGSLLLSVFAVEDFLVRGGTWRNRLIRAGAPNSDYNWLTTYLVLAIPILLAWVWHDRTFRSRMLGLITVTSAFIAQGAAYTRAGWLAHFAQAFGFVLMTQTRRLMLYFILGVAGLGSGLAAISAVGYQRDTVDPWTFNARMKTWQLGFEQVIRHPIVGVGYGNETFVLLYTAEIQADKDKGAEEKVLPALHNTFAMVLMGSGIPALILFAWMLIRIVRVLGLFKRHLLLQTQSILWVAPAISLAVIGFAVRNAFDYMFAGSLATLFWILVALGLSIEGGEHAVRRPCGPSLASDSR